jgi:DNA end-binding protein Ku
MLLRCPYEVRDSAEYYDDIQDVKITKDNRARFYGHYQR